MFCPPKLAQSPEIVKLEQTEDVRWGCDEERGRTKEMLENIEGRCGEHQVW